MVIHKGNIMRQQVNFEQIVGEVKERNRLYNILQEIREISSMSLSLNELEECRDKFVEILEKCDSVL